MDRRDQDFCSVGKTRHSLPDTPVPSCQQQQLLMKVQSTVNSIVRTIWYARTWEDDDDRSKMTTPTPAAVVKE